MIYKGTNFREFYHHFIVFMLNDFLRPAVEDFPNADKANCILTYGYIDHEVGLTMEILATGNKTKDDFSFYEGNDSIRTIIRIESVENNECFQLKDEESKFRATYNTKIAMLKGYDVSDEIEATRDMEFLDSCRHPHYVDDVLVYLIKKDCAREGCWVRISGIQNHSLVGILLNEPAQKLGVHRGELISFRPCKQSSSFHPYKGDDERIVCVSDLQ